MATPPVLLCIYADPERLSVLQENGYDLLIAENGCEGLGVLGAHAVDAVVLEYHLGLLDGSVIASEIKQVKPNVPIVMLAEPEELPADALQAVDALVSTSDPPHFLWAAVHFALSMRQGVNFRTRSRSIQVAGSTGKSSKSTRRPQMYSSQTARYDEHIA
jgi:DNA-binding response OmpR family regulator